MKKVMRIRASEIKTLKDIRQEKARLNYELLRSRLQLTSQFDTTRDLFSFQNLMQPVKRAILRSIGNALIRFIQ